MSFNSEHVQYILARFSAGVSSRQILDELQYRAYLPWINIATVERCLCENGRLPEIPTRSANQGGPGGPSTVATQNARRSPTSAGVGRFSNSDNLDDPGPTLPWDSLADNFAISAYRGGKSEDDIWVTLRNYGYDISRPEVVASLIKQGISGARWTPKGIMETGGPLVSFLFCMDWFDRASFCAVRSLTMNFYLVLKKESAKLD